MKKNYILSLLARKKDFQHYNQNMFKILYRTESYFTATDLHSNTQSNPYRYQGIFGAGIATSGGCPKMRLKNQTVLHPEQKLF